MNALLPPLPPNTHISAIAVGDKYLRLHFIGSGLRTVHVAADADALVHADNADAEERAVAAVYAREFYELAHGATLSGGAWRDAVTLVAGPDFSALTDAELGELAHLAQVERRFDRDPLAPGEYVLASRRWCGS